jgi:hypothetical protein
MRHYLTVLDADLNELVRRTPPGMAFWSGTGPKRTCGQCEHFGELVSKKYGCRLYTKQTGYEVQLLKDTAACKYFLKSTKATEGRRRA